MKKIASVLLLSTLCITFSCKTDKKETIESEKPPIEENVTKLKPREAKTVTIKLNSKSNSNVTGKIAFKDEEGIVKMYGRVNGLDQGVHAIHIHQTADCSSEDGKSAGGHWNPTAQPHGQWGDEKGYHKGDIGNFEADENGNGKIEFATDQWCIGCGDPEKDILGKAIIVHQGTDDYTSQPSGAAGARVSCAGIIE